VGTTLTVREPQLGDSATVAETPFLSMPAAGG